MECMKRAYLVLLSMNESGKLKRVLAFTAVSKKQ